MTILFLKDWDEYPEAIVDTKTKNKSFLRLSAMYRTMGIKNHSFILQLHNKDLQGIDPFDEDLDIEVKAAIAIECKNNFFYFIRECVHIPGGSFDNPITFRANRGNIALYWSFFNHITNILIQPRQTGKSISTDVLMRNLLNIRCTNTKINLLTKDDTLRSANLNRLKDLEQEIPSFLRLRTKADLANTEELTIKALGNSYRGHVPNKSPKMAMNVGRGLTSPIFHVDEAAFFYNVAITIPAALAAGTAAREVAKMKNEPYGNIFTTTSGKKDDRDGKYIYNMLCNSAVWTEAFFDCKDIDDLEKTIRANSPSGELRLNCTFSHRQLGYTDEWLREALENSMATGDDADRDFFNIWTSGTQISPLTTEEAKVIRESMVVDFHAQIVSPFSYIVRWFIPEDEIERRLTTDQFIMGMDTSDAIGNDDITMIIRSVSTGETIAAGNYNETNLITFSEWLSDWLIKYPNITLVIERRSTGAMIIDYLILILTKNGINPFTRIYNKIVQESEEYPDKWKQISRLHSTSYYETAMKFKKSFGFATSSTGATSRTELYSTTLKAAIKMTGSDVRDPMTVEQLLGLIVKNGRVDHEQGEHDDMCISWLLSFWLLTNGKNLSYYGIDTSKILYKNLINLSDNSPKNIYDNNLQEQYRNEVEELVEKIQKERDIFLTKRLEQRLRFIVSKLPEHDQVIVSVDELINSLRKQKKIYR